MYSPSESIQNTIQRCPHDKENPYAQVNRDLIRDESLSPQCRWMLIYLLSMKDGWVINPKQIVNHLKGMMGRDKVYQMINEAVEAGYILKEVKIIKNLKNLVTYFVSETPKFKKILRYPEIQETETWDTEDQDYKKTMSKQDHIDIDKDNVLPEPPDLNPGPPIKTYKTKIKIDNEKTMPRSTDQKSTKTMDAKRRWKLTDEQYQNLVWLQDNGVNSDEGTLAHWVKTYPFERLYDVLNHAKSKNPDNLGAYMQKLFKTDAIVENNTIKANAAFAKDFAQAHEWNELKVLGKYCTFPMNGTDVEIPLSLNSQDFIKMLIEKHEISTK